MKILNPFRLGLLGGLGVLVAVGIGQTVISLATILTYVGAALFLALGLDPVVTWLETKKFPRWTAILTVLAGVLGVFTGLIFAIVPVIAEQVRNASEAIPRLVTAFFDGTVRESVETAFPWLNVQDLLDGFNVWIADLDFTTIGGGVFAVGIGIATGITGAIIVLILTIYFVSSLNNIKGGLYQLVPATKRAKFIDLAEQVSAAVGRYVIGQGSLALVNGVLSFLVLTLIFPAFGLPVKYSALLAFIAFVGSLIPLVGTLSGSIVITLLVLLFNGPPSVIAVGIYYLIYMQVEAYLLNPRIMNKAVKIPGALVVIAALAGGTLLGILGALIAIPVAAAILLIVQQVVVPRQADL
ncbi:AI-2E family transporter [Salinibacterium sp. NSLL150]|uniref:AI-2E family transporter n=1 Tax=unclassified Salinibacterium TaxID=2632331 RepID=UPI0018CEFDE8|nr:MULTISPECIES: AI-2E family transporter [unclassified Salinibacterium]MBH0023735.1 AI-2E family transporter [Salinibacterium sp. SWN248]MBH0098705.1 AI-2E family transporter [Salinibacterium sp. NSLL35]MBH0101460.1 AI-2E family transporter [Salinibacterium sp. NSLL150]MBH0104219.1 AI-2E family transporter [Salinibacterium sp. NSLL16]MBH0106980.1 AI-2E family transporter [Salinibacterium sp. NSLL17]